MNKIFSALRRLLRWLGETESFAQPAPTPPDWADLPIHHPRRD